MKERMRSLRNLYRVLDVDELVNGLPTEASFDNPRFGVNEATTIERLRAP